MKSRELLENFIYNISEAESMEKIIFLQDISLCQGIIAWKNLEIEFINEETEYNELTEESWKRLWDFCNFDMDNFAVFIGKKYSDAEDILKRLAFLKLIYPDGNVDKYALSYSRNVSKNMVSKLFTKSKDKDKK